MWALHYQTSELWDRMFGTSNVYRVLQTLYANAFSHIFGIFFAFIFDFWMFRSRSSEKRFLQPDVSAYICVTPSGPVLNIPVIMATSMYSQTTNLYEDTGYRISLFDRYYELLTICKIIPIQHLYINAGSPAHIHTSKCQFITNKFNTMIGKTQDDPYLNRSFLCWPVFTCILNEI